MQTFPEEPFRADFYVYVIGIAGSAKLMVNNEPVQINAGIFFTAIPSTILQVKSHTKNFKAKVLVFERPFLLNNILDARQLEHLGFFNYHSLANLLLTERETRLLCGLLDHLHDRSLKESLFLDSIVQSLIFNLLLETAEIFIKHKDLVRKKSVSHEEDIFIRFMKLVQQNFHHRRQLSFFSNKLFVSDKYLIQVCKNIAGKTPGAILAETTLNDAKLLLNNPDNNINLVSQAYNYASVAAFSKFFKKHTGMSPKKWKEKII